MRSISRRSTLPAKYIEGGIAYLAAQQRTDGELAILESILGKLKAAIRPVISCPFLNTTARSTMIFLRGA